MVRSHHNHESEVSVAVACEIPPMNEVVVRTLIHQKLDEIRSGDLFVQHNLKDDSVDELLGDPVMYKTFESIIGKTWMEVDMLSNGEGGLNGGKLNRKKKMYIRALKAASSFVREQIETYIMQRDGDFPVDDDDDKDEKEGHFESGEEDTVSSLSDSKISRSSASQKRKKKKKSKKKKHKDKKKSKKRKKRQSHDSDVELDRDDGDDDADSVSAPPLTKREEKRLQRRLEKATIFFETEREDIIKQIPNDVKNDFRSLGFARWGKEYLACMQLGPYDVGPGGVRDRWMEMFNNTMLSKRPLTRLIFWYGTPEDDLSTGFSFVPQNKVISWEEGCKLKYHKLPAKITKKLENEKKLTATESQLIDGLDQIIADTKLEPHERSPWLFEFEEDYEDYFDHIDDETSDEENDETIDGPVSSKGSDQKKKKKGQKAKKQKVDKGKERDSKKKKRKRKSDDEEVSKKKKSKSIALDEEIEQEVAEEDAVMQINAPSDDDQHDDDFNDNSSESDEELYQDNVEVIAKKKTPTNSKSKSKSKKQVPKSPEDLEQELFEECEKFFLPIMAKLNGVEDEVVAAKFLRKIDREVQRLTPSFFRTHQIGLVVKGARSQFKENATLNQLCKQITSKMKKVFHEKLSSEPKGFQPKAKKTTKKKSAKKKKPEIKEEQRDESPATERKDTISLKKINRTPRSTDDASKDSVVPKKDISEPSVEEQKPSSKTTPKPVKSKAPRKSFSLAGMIERKPTATHASASTVSIEKDNERDTAVEVQEKIKQPQWTVNYPSSGPNSFESNPERSFAMQFLTDAVSCLPKGKVDPASVALALEDALYTKYESDHDRYMERLHDICAGIAGKKQMGSLAQKIIDGNYATPLDIINIPQKLLFQSFEGFWIP